MIALSVNNKGIVSRISYNPKRVLPSEITVEELPELPEYDVNTQTPVLMYKFGKLYYAIQKIDVLEEPEPSIIEHQEETEYKPSNEELRKSAYEAEADQFAMAYIGYMLEGNTSKAEEAKNKYLQTKYSIRKQYP